MRTVTIFLFLFILPLTFYGQNSSILKQNSDTFKLSVSTRQSSTYNGYGLNLSFSVYKNGKFIHPSDPSDGRYIGCRYPWNGAGSNYTIEQLKGFGGRSIGWTIKGMYDICATDYSRQKQIFILPFDDTYYSFCIYYQDYYFDAVIEDVSKNVLSIWYNEYVWAGRAMPDHYLIPRKIDLVKSEYGLEIRNGDLMQGKDNIEKVIPKGEIFFVSLFNAAFTQTDPELLQYAINLYFNEKDKEIYEVYNIPTSRKEMNELLVSLKEMHDMQEQQKTVMDKFELRKSNIPNLFSFK